MGKTKIIIFNYASDDNAQAAFPKHAAQAIKTSSVNAIPIIDKTIPAVAIPDGAFFLEIIPNTSPTIPITNPKKLSPPINEHTTEIIPNTKDATAISHTSLLYLHIQKIS